jgi:hypothetical protein
MHGTLATMYEALDFDAEIALAEGREDDWRAKYLLGLVASEAAIVRMTGATSEEIGAALVWMLADGAVQMGEVQRFESRIRGPLAGLITTALGHGYEVMRRSAEYGASSMIAAGLDRKQVNAIALATSTELVPTGAGGYPLADTVTKNVASIHADVLARVRRGAMAGEKDGGAIRDDVEAIVKRGADKIAGAVQTEANGAFNNAVKKAHPKTRAKGLLWVLSAAHTKKLNCACERHNGKVFAVDAPEIAMFPPHPFCQCWLVPEL